MSFNNKIYDMELEVIKSFRGYIDTKTFDKICRVLDQHAETDTITFYNLDVFVFAIDMTDIDGDWTAQIRETE